MRFLSVLLLSSLVGCGDDGPKGMPDLSVPVVDMVQPVADMSAPPDLAKPLCLLPRPGTYGENMAFIATQDPPGGGAPQQWGAGASAIVSPSGDIFRSKNPITQLFSFHCDSVIGGPDPKTCKAPCCQYLADPDKSAQIYYTENGWVMLDGGKCSWKDPSNGITWTLNFMYVNGTRNPGFWEPPQMDEMSRSAASRQDFVSLFNFSSGLPLIDSAN